MEIAKIVLAWTFLICAITCLGHTWLGFSEAMRLKDPKDSPFYIAAFYSVGLLPVFGFGALAFILWHP